MAEQNNNNLENRKEVAEKPQKQKPNAFARAGKKISKWFRELTSEAKKVVWPTWKQVANNTGVVIVCIVAVGIFVWLLDAGFSTLRNLLIGLIG
ncbi:preprotein translocase subunit SecE [Acidaminobacterium chupaoyuni]